MAERRSEPLGRKEKAGREAPRDTLSGRFEPHQAMLRWAPKKSGTWPARPSERAPDLSPNLFLLFYFPS